MDEVQMCRMVQEKIEIIYEVYDPNNPTKHVRGERIGRPYIVFKSSKKGYVMVDIWKIGGVNTNPRILPDWAAYHLSHIRIIGEKEKFEPNESTFNPNSPRYSNTICSAR